MPPRYANKEPEQVAHGVHVGKFSAIAERAEHRLDQLVAATSLAELGLPGLRLEPLKGDRAGQYSVRINNQWRICFNWLEGDPEPSNIEIVDYH